MPILRPFPPTDGPWIDPNTGWPTQMFADYLRTLDVVLRGAWQSYTPSLAAGSGTFTTASATGAYQQIGKTVHARGVVTITTAGTAAGDLIVGLPSTTKERAVGAGYEEATGVDLVARAAAAAATVALHKDDATTIIATGRTVEFSLTYEQA